MKLRNSGNFSEIPKRAFNAVRRLILLRVLPCDTSLITQFLGFWMKCLAVMITRQATRAKLVQF